MNLLVAEFARIQVINLTRISEFLQIQLRRELYPNNSSGTTLSLVRELATESGENVFRRPPRSPAVGETLLECREFRNAAVACGLVGEPLHHMPCDFTGAVFARHVFRHKDVSVAWIARVVDSDILWR